MFENSSSACVRSASLPYTQMRTDPTAVPPYSMVALVNCLLALAGGASVRSPDDEELATTPAPETPDEPELSESLLMVTADES